MLSRKGFRVTVLEGGSQIGGCLQSFSRGGIRFDTGFHSVAGLAPGDPLFSIFEPLGLMDLPWEKVSSPDEVVVGWWTAGRISCLLPPRFPHSHP